MIFQLRDGKDLVLIREDYSDPLDFISCLCLHTCEAEKLRKRFFSPHVSALLHAFVSAHPIETPEQQKEVLARLPLSKHEQEGLLAIWPKDVLHRLWDLVVHHENFSLQVDIPQNYVRRPPLCCCYLACTCSPLTLSFVSITIIGSERTRKMEHRDQTRQYAAHGRPRRCVSSLWLSFRIL